MTASISLLGGQGQQVSNGAPVQRFFRADADGLKISETSPPSLDIFVPLPIGSATRSETYPQQFRGLWPPMVSVLVVSSSQRGFSPCGGLTVPPTAMNPERVNQQLGSQACHQNSRVDADGPPSRPRIVDHRVPYISMIRAMLDRDQVAAARALLSVALAESPNATELLRSAEILAVPTSARRSVQDSDRRREYSWLAAHARALRGKWIALVGSELVGSAASLTELLESLKPSGAQKLALIHRVE